MVNPIFLSISRTFQVPASYAGYITSIYSMGSVLSCALAFFYIDRLNKKKYLLVSVFMLTILTLLCSISYSIRTLIFLRFVSGFFGGGILALGFGILLNQTPAQVRGRIIAIVISAFSFVSIIGIPSAIYISSHYSWVWCFRLLSFLLFLSFLLVLILVRHKEANLRERSKIKLNIHTVLAFSTNGISQFPTFILMPILVPFLIQNMHVKFSQMPLIFMIGGAFSYLGTKLSGVLCDKYGSILISMIFSGLFVVNLLSIYTNFNSANVFVSTLLFATYGRMVASSTLISHFPKNEHRVGFNMLQTMSMHISTACAFMLSSVVIGSATLDRLNIKYVIMLSIIISLLLPLILKLIYSVIFIRQGKLGRV